MDQMITKEDFNGLGKRVTDLREDFIGCNSSRGERLDALEKTQIRNQNLFDRLFSKIETLEKKVSVMWAKITAGVAVVVIIIQLAFNLLSKV